LPTVVEEFAGLRRIIERRQENMSKGVALPHPGKGQPPAVPRDGRKAIAVPARGRRSQLPLLSARHGDEDESVVIPYDQMLTV
jgi:hypothetical protein